jgi:hypothetical protein
MTVAKGPAKYKLDLVGVQKLGWDRSGTRPAGECAFVYGKGSEDNELGTLFVHKGIISAVQSVDYTSDRMSNITLRSRWYDIIVLNVHAPIKDKIRDIKDRSTKNLNMYLIILYFSILLHCGEDRTKDKHTKENNIQNCDSRKKNTMTESYICDTTT